jgi:hypothetical protein
MHRSDNTYHNFEHASHSMMSVLKYFNIMASASYDNTFGVNGDPLTQFTCLLSSLVPSVDNEGVTNAQLVKENSKVARHYGKSAIEQKAIDLVWGLLNDSMYTELRETICPYERDSKVFRQLFLHSVLATDVFDPDLNQDRGERWRRAFEKNDSVNSENRDRQAILVIEVVMQASEVVHTMQHWDLFRKWDENLFAEQLKAFKQGRADDPREFWYQNKLDFFDTFVIPLADKINTCGCFGSLCSDAIAYAMKNRQDWNSSGLAIVKEMGGRLNRAGGTYRSTLATPILSKSDHIDDSLHKIADKKKTTNFGSALQGLMMQVQAMEQTELLLISVSEHMTPADLSPSNMPDKGETMVETADINNDVSNISFSSRSGDEDGSDYTSEGESSGSFS